MLNLAANGWKDSSANWQFCGRNGCTLREVFCLLRLLFMITISMQDRWMNKWIKLEYLFILSSCVKAWIFIRQPVTWTIPIFTNLFPVDRTALYVHLLSHLLSAAELSLLFSLTLPLWCLLLLVFSFNCSDAVGISCKIKAYRVSLSMKHHQHVFF